MPVASTQTLVQRPPSKGDTLVYDTLEYVVTGVSRYSEDDYQVSEWCCETASTECYLLRETKAGAPIRWFFTRWFPAKEAALPGGGALPSWKEPQAAPTPPPALMRGGDIFKYAETTDGQFEDDDGLRQRKITWDYWNEGRKRNLAIELWADGGQDCYSGVYIKPEDVVFRPGVSIRAGGGGALDSYLSGFGAFGRFAVLVPCCYVFIMFVIGLPFDECLALSLALAAFFTVAAFQSLITEAVAVGLSVIGLTFLFGHHPPLSDPLGLAGLLGGPLFVALLCRRLATPKAAASFFCALTAAAPAAIVGYYHYFAHAPGPHSFDQLLLALTPAAAGGLVGTVAGLLAPSGLGGEAAS
jgi:hypothetical protein